MLDTGEETCAWRPFSERPQCKQPEFQGFLVQGHQVPVGEENVEGLCQRDQLQFQLIYVTLLVSQLTRDCALELSAM